MTAPTEHSEMHTAIHEAGHAVAFYRLFGDGPRYSGDLTIVQDGERLGAHAAEDLSGVSDAAYLDSEAVYACAGYAALIVAGFGEDVAATGCESDFEQAVNFSDRPLAQSKAAAVELLHLPENARAVDLIAHALMERRRIPSDEVDILLDVADGLATEAELERYRHLKAAAMPPGVQ